jgi:hypothetical protein
MFRSSILAVVPANPHNQPGHSNEGKWHCERSCRMGTDVKASGISTIE